MPLAPDATRRADLVAQINRLLSFEAAAVKAGGSRRIIERAVRVGELPVIRLNARCVRIDPDDLAAFLAKRRAS